MAFLSRRALTFFAGVRRRSLVSRKTARRIASCVRSLSLLSFLSSSLRVQVRNMTIDALLPLSRVASGRAEEEEPSSEAKGKKRKGHRCRERDNSKAFQLRPRFFFFFAQCAGTLTRLFSSSWTESKTKKRQKRNGMRGLNSSTASTSAASTTPAPSMLPRPSVAARCSCSCSAASPASAARASSQRSSATVRAVSASASASSFSPSSSSFGGLPPSRRQRFSQSSSSPSRGRHLASHVVRASQDYYEVLGVKRDADKKAIKQAYR